MSTQPNANMKLRKVTILDLSDITTTILTPDTVIFRHVHKTNHVNHTLDITSFCYKKRAPSPPNQIGDFVDPSSLDIHRLNIARQVIDLIRGQSFDVAKNYKHWFSTFMNWTDANYPEVMLGDLNGMKIVYIGYTAHLFQRISSSPKSDDHLTATVAANYQKGAYKFISIATGEDPRIIKTWSTRLRKSKPGILKAGKPSSEEQDMCFAAHINFLDEVHRVIVEGENYPIKLIPPAGETYYLYDDIGFRKSYTLKLMYAELKKHPTLPPLEILIADSEELSNLSEKEKQLAYAALTTKVATSNSENRNAYRSKNLVTMAMAAGLVSFIAATGGNSSVVSGIEPSDFKPIPSSKGKRLLGIKARAYGKTVHPEFGARYSSTYNKILELRKWLLGPKDTPLLFPFPKRDGRFATILASHLQAYKSLLDKLMPEVTWVTPTDYRKNVSYQYLKISNGDTLLTAQKLGNTVGTVETHYGRPSLEDFAKEFTAFFDAMQNAAVARGRYQNHIPVHIIETDSASVEIPGGACMSAVGEPKLEIGFTSHSPTPSCREPEYCVFCKYYAIHADTTDIKRLLSIKFIIEVSQAHYDSARWAEYMYPLQYRLNEVITAVSEKVSDKQLVNKIQAEVESGELDPFWASHLDALIYMGYVS